MTKNLVIVESPSKSKTIEKYLGKDYKVVSSKGHIRDLATSGKYGFGVDVDNHFAPKYEPIKGKKKVITELKKEANKVDKVYLATDPDREGEAISWHLKDALELDDKHYQRITFNEITKDKVINSFKEARMIDNDLVHSQETRRILDRIIGFRLSKLMQSKTGGKSAGRVQSVALKLIVDREDEINKFIPEEYWSITAKFENFDAELEKYLGKKIEVHNELEATEILNKLLTTFKIESTEKKEKKRSSKPPFITSTLQQEASTKLNFSSAKTMSLAQKLYEGIDLKNETVGLITYMRTDSIRLSDSFVGEAYHYIEVNYGTNYTGAIKKAKKKDNVQDAHEAIRPSSILRTPDSVKTYLSNDEYKLYKLIYFRTLASLMKEARFDQTTAYLENNGYLFKATGQTMKFDGYLKVYSDYESSEDKELPPLDTYNSNVLVCSEIIPTQHFTSPASRYTEAKLIKEMEELGIGRPSTYATIIKTLIERDYVKLMEKKFFPTDIGIETTIKLQEFFSDIINVKYTASMETSLDHIAEGNKIWYELLEEFYQKFTPEVEKAFENMEKKAPEETGELCPNCNSPMVYKKGKYGKFEACSNYPTCKYIKQEKKEVKEIINCPKCNGKIIEKKTRKGKVFYGCNNYPTCNTAVWDIPTGELCDDCKSLIVIKKNKKICSSCGKEY